MSELNSRVALVTGGARGIGAAIVRHLSEQGAAVAFTYVTSQEIAENLAAEIAATGGRALAIRADSGIAAEVTSAVSATVARFGRLDILVNNAAIELPGSIETYQMEDFDRMMAVNIRGVFVATQEAARHMREGGRIINIGSVSSDHMPVSGHAVYAMTKGAIASLTRGLARDLGPRGITVNNVQPGRIDTDLFRGIQRAAGGDKLLQAIALNRFGKSEEIAGLVGYLVGAQGAFVTGASLKVDGGASI